MNYIGSAGSTTGSMKKKLFKCGQHKQSGKAPLKKFKSIRFKCSPTYFFLTEETITNLIKNGLSLFVRGPCLMLLGSIIHSEISKLTTTWCTDYSKYVPESAQIAHSNIQISYLDIFTTIHRFSYQFLPFLGQDGDITLLLCGSRAMNVKTSQFL